MDITLHLHIPSLQVGLIGVAPNRSAPSPAERAEASAKVDTIITHAHASIEKGGRFEFGLRAFERQLILGPGHFENFADMGFIGAANTAIFNSFRDNGDPSEPVFSVDSVSTDVRLGTLNTGDTL
jgi:hypothetical protein